MPAGVPTGGQFAASAHAESGIALDPTADHRRETPVEEMGRTACMDFLNPRRMHPALPRIVSAEYSLDSLRDLVTQVREHDAEHGIWEPPVRSAIDAYADEAEAIRMEHATVTEGYDRLDPQVRPDRCAAAAEHYEHVAREAANRIEPKNLPNPGRVILSGLYGRVRGAAEAAATERASMYGPPRPEQVEAGTDALVEKVLDTRDFTAANGVPFRARLVRKGMSWGRDGSLVADRDTVMFFDARYPDHDPMIGHESEDRAATERNGQFVGSYHVETLRGRSTGYGLNLDDGVPDWSIDAESTRQVLDWMDRRSPLRDNPFAHCNDLHALVTSEEPTRRRYAHGETGDFAGIARRLGMVKQAYATRRREVERGWDSVA